MNCISGSWRVVRRTSKRRVSASARTALFATLYGMMLANDHRVGSIGNNEFTGVGDTPRQPQKRRGAIYEDNLPDIWTMLFLCFVDSYWIFIILNPNIQHGFCSIGS